MAQQLNCPCGTQIAALDDEFLAQVHQHLADQHPGRSYSDAEIMMMAMPVPDRVVRPDA